MTIETTLILPLSADGRILTEEAIRSELDPTWRQTPGIPAVLAQFFDFSSTSPSHYSLIEASVCTHLNETSLVQSTPRDPTLRLVVLDTAHALSDHGRNVLNHLANHVIYIDTLSDESLNTVSTAGVTSLSIMPSLTHNAFWFDNPSLLSHLSLIIYPLVVGGRGQPIFAHALFKPAHLRYTQSKVFDANYINIQYDIVR